MSCHAITVRTVSVDFRMRDRRENLLTGRAAASNNNNNNNKSDNF